MSKLALNITHKDLSFVVVSYHLPKFSPCAVWRSHGTIFGNDTVIRSEPRNIFIDKNNKVYISLADQNETVIWQKDGSSITKILSDGIEKPHSVFMSVNGDIFVDDGYANGRVVMWAANGTGPLPIINVSSFCRDLFIDTNNVLYCSLDNEHQVIKVSLNGSARSIAAGNGTNGSGADLLHHPKGIFVDFHLNLYVADCNNNRIQLFKPNQSFGKTEVGEEASGTINLHCPIDIVLDGDGYLFITDHNNHRIVRSGPAGFRCLIGCSGRSGVETNYLHDPKAISFDSFGNIFVADGGNKRILKFLLVNNSCGEYKILSQTDD